MVFRLNLPNIACIIRENQLATSIGNYLLEEAGKALTVSIHELPLDEQIAFLVLGAQEIIDRPDELKTLIDPFVAAVGYLGGLPGGDDAGGDDVIAVVVAVRRTERPAQSRYVGRAVALAAGRRHLPHRVVLRRPCATGLPDGRDQPAAHGGPDRCARDRTAQPVRVSRDRPLLHRVKWLHAVTREMDSRAS